MFYRLYTLSYKYTYLVACLHMDGGISLAGGPAVRLPIRWRFAFEVQVRRGSHGPGSSLIQFFLSENALNILKY